MSGGDATPLAAERKRIIREILGREGVVRSAELKELLHASIVTIRSDLQELERAGVCELVWGGAVSKRPSPEREAFLTERSKIHADIKQRIGKRAAQLVRSGQTIVIDAGSTTIELVDHLPRNLEYLQVVTPALNVAAAAAQFPNVELIMPGGVLRNLTLSLVGPSVIRALEMVNADIAFLASGGFSIEYGVTTSNLLDVEVKRAIAHCGAKIVLMADSTKFGVVRSLTVVPMNAVDILITDDRLDAQDAQALEKLNIEVQRV